MILDRTQSQILSRLAQHGAGLVTGEWALGHPWRHLCALDRPAEVPTRDVSSSDHGVLALFRRELTSAGSLNVTTTGEADADGLRLLADKVPDMTHVDRDAWLEATANAIVGGLAYGVWESERVRAAETRGWLRMVLATTESTSFALNHTYFGSGAYTFDAVSDRTFSLLAVTAGAAHVVGVLVVDED